MIFLNSPAEALTGHTDDLRVWFLGLTIAFVFIPALGFLLAREFKQKDRFEHTLKQLNDTIAELNLTIEGIRLWTSERFVSRMEHKEDIESLKKDIAEHAARFEKDLDRCQERCPSGA